MATMVQPPMESAHFFTAPVMSGRYRYIYQRIHLNNNTKASNLYNYDTQKSGGLYCSDQPQLERSSSSTPPTRLAKRVRFQEDSNSYHESTVMCMEDCQDLWYSPAHLKILKKQVTRFLKDIVQIEQGQEDTLTFRKVFQDMYDACLAAPDCDSDDRDDLVAVADDQAQVLLQTLSQWMSIATDRWGLERPSVRQVHFDRSCRRKAMLHQVLEVQSMIQHLNDTAVKADCVAKAAKAISRPSRLFARVLAQAQETALNHQCG